MLKIRLLFKKNRNLSGEWLEILTTKNVKLWGYYFYMNLNIWGDFQICINVICIIEVQMLLRCCLIHTVICHHTNIHFIFSVFVFMSRPRSIYVVSMWPFFFVFSFLFIFINHKISLKQTHWFFAHFLEYSLLLYRGWRKWIISK